MCFERNVCFPFLLHMVSINGELVLCGCAKVAIDGWNFILFSSVDAVTKSCLLYISPIFA